MKFRYPETGLFVSSTGNNCINIQRQLRRFYLVVAAGAITAEAAHHPPVLYRSHRQHTNPMSAGVPK